MWSTSGLSIMDRNRAYALGLDIRRWPSRKRANASELSEPDKPVMTPACHGEYRGRFQGYASVRLEFEYFPLCMRWINRGVYPARL